MKPSTHFLLFAALVSTSCRMPQGSEVQRLNGPLTIDLSKGLSDSLWVKNGGDWEVEDGVLRSRGGENRYPIWLARSVPDSFELHFEARADSAAVDQKVEFCADGVRHESGYVAILGGWSNSLAVIARQDEHEKARTEKKGHWEARRWYHWTVRRTVRAGTGTIEWLLDDKPFMTRRDPKPLIGKGHDRIGFNNWKTDVSYRNIRLTPIDPES
jgi:hypothetical protein